MRLKSVYRDAMIILSDLHEGEINWSDNTMQAKHHTTTVRVSFAFSLISLKSAGHGSET